MFILSGWLVEGLKAGYSDKTFSFARITELTAGYLSRGLISDAQAEDIALHCPAPCAETDGGGTV